MSRSIKQSQQATIDREVHILPLEMLLKSHKLIATKEHVPAHAHQHQQMEFPSELNLEHNVGRPKKLILAELMRRKTNSTESAQSTHIFNDIEKRRGETMEPSTTKLILQERKINKEKAQKYFRSAANSEELPQINPIRKKPKIPLAQHLPRITLTRTTVKTGTARTDESKLSKAIFSKNTLHDQDTSTKHEDISNQSKVISVKSTMKKRKKSNAMQEMMAKLLERTKVSDRVIIGGNPKKSPMHQTKSKSPIVEQRKTEEYKPVQEKRQELMRNMRNRTMLQPIRQKSAINPADQKFFVQLARQQQNRHSRNHSVEPAIEEDIQGEDKNEFLEKMPIKEEPIEESIGNDPQSIRKTNKKPNAKSLNKVHKH